MNGCNSKTMSNCCCGSTMNPQFWSKNKKLKVLKESLDCINEKKKDIQDAIEELKKED